MKRREFLLAAAGVIGAASVAPISLAQSHAPGDAPRLDDDVAWHPAQEIGLDGRAFNDTESYFDRLPKRARGIVRPPVWDLSHDTAGMSVRFTADTPAIYIRYELTKKNLAMAHMPATGVSGVDLYGRDDNKWRYVATHLPRSQSISAKLADDLPAGSREWLIHLPLYNGVKSMEIGLPKSSAATLARPPGAQPKPVLFYGTSITQGGCASRPGMAFTNILARRLQRPVLNFGFSGNGKMETSVGQFLGEIDAAVFVVDCNANMRAADDITADGPELIKLLRQMRGPAMPILLLDERLEPACWIDPRRREVHEKKSAALKQVYQNLADAGDKNIHFQGDAGLIGDDGEATVDGSHPTDLGMMRYAAVLEPVLRKLIG